MPEELDYAAKRIGGDIIDISAALDEKMDKWSDLPGRPDTLSSAECIGFINKETAVSGLNLVVDVQAPAAKDTATIRTWAVLNSQDDNGAELFNNIQLDFSTDYSKGRELTQKQGLATRDHIHGLLKDAGTRLERVIVSNQSGFDKTSQQPLGQRYDVAISDLQDDDTVVPSLLNALNDVLTTLKRSAASEGKS